MPKEWYDRASNRISEDLSENEIAKKQFNLRILADKKPYFMRYIYPGLMNQYNTYLKNTNKKCLREFRQSIDELIDKDPNELTEAETEFIAYYIKRMPVGMHQCVMNKICKRFEEEFDNYFLKNTNDNEFDYRLMKSGQEYTTSQYYTILKLYEQYTKRLQEYMQFSKRERIDEDEAVTKRGLMIKDFKTECQKVCSNAMQLCDIILDICYRRSDSKQFCWDICSEEIIYNLFQNNDNTISFPVQNANGDIKFCGNTFSFESKRYENDKYSP